jgi:hypothetical protein
VSEQSLACDLVLGSPVGLFLLRRCTDHHSAVLLAYVETFRPKVSIASTDDAGEVRNVSLLVAIGVNGEGYREILGICEGAKEDKAGLRSWLFRKCACSPDSPRVVLADGFEAYRAERKAAGESRRTVQRLLQWDFGPLN